MKLRGMHLRVLRPRNELWGDRPRTRRPRGRHPRSTNLEIPVSRLLILGALLALARPLAAQQQAYDPLPLISSPALDSAALQTERQSLLEWMGTATSASQDELLAARERLYYVIGSAARQDFYAQLGQGPAFDPADLAQLFEVGASLGVYGAADIARSLPLSPQDAIGAAPAVPEGLRVQFAPPMLRVASDSGGWTAEVPYYFMIGILQRAEINGGLSEIASISTLFAANKNREGVSQATILLVSAPGQDPAAFEDFWLAQVGVARENALPESPLAGATAFRTRDEAADMNKEVVLIRTSRGPLFVAYLGLTGPFEANRINFIDFLQHLRLP